MKIAIGSTNPAKVRAVESIALKIWPEGHFVPVAALSGVGDMPMSSDECLAGARNRARAALQMTGADMGIGLEGGVNQEDDGLMLTGWAVVVDSHGREGIGGGARLPLPVAIANRVLDGEELGLVIDELLDEENVKQRGGAVGALTSGLVMRSETFAIAVAFALAPFVTPEFYRE